MRFFSIILRCLAATALALLAACETLTPGKPPVTATPTPPPVASVPAPVPAPTEVTPAPKPPAPASALRATGWDAVANWRDDNPQLAWSAFIGSCGALKNQAAWQSVCSVATALPEPTREMVVRFFETNFTPYQVVNADGTDSGLVTGYYEPLLNGSRKRSARYHVPVFGVPDDMLVIDLGEVYPELKNMRLRGRVDGRRVVPYYNRAQIDSGAAPVTGKEIVWVEDSIELFFMQVQGSGRIKLDGKETIMLGYADQNGYPYRSIGRLLVERGDLPLEKASMQGIKAWAKQNPDKLQELLNYNASYVFFRELPRDLPGPLGALGIPLTARRSIAVDARYIPLGAPVFLATTMPNSRHPLNRLMIAQDTGGAIRGAVRADFFWGFGEEAATLAGRMRQSGKMWVMLPNGYPLPAAN
jgi:membrane-bound lytic murein transglycosylase A